MRRFLFIMMFFPCWVTAQESLNLQQARQMALDHSRQLKMDRLESESSALQSRSAYTNFFPRLDAEAGYQRRNKQYKLFDSDKFLPVVPYQGIDGQTGNFDPSVLENPQLAPSILVFHPETGELVRDADGNPVFQQYAWLPRSEGKIGQKNNWQMGLELRQPIYMGGKIRSGYQIAQKAENIARAQIHMSTSEVIFRTDELFWQVIALEEKVELTHAYLEMLGKLVNDLENLFQEGIITRNQVLQAQVRYNEVELLMVQAGNGLRLSRMALNQHLGISFDEPTQLSNDFDVEMLLLDTENLTQTALSQRPELQMLNEAAAIAQQMIQVKRADMLPSVGLMAGYNLTNPNPYNGFKDEFGGDYAIGVGISIPVFHFGDKRREVARAKIAQQQVELQRQDAREMIELQVNQNMLNLQEAIQKTELATLSLQQAEENLSVTQNLFEEGRATTRDVLEAQAHWQDAFATQIEASAGKKLAYSKLQKNLGNIHTNN